MITLPETYINNRPKYEALLQKDNENGWSTENRLDFYTTTENRDISNKPELIIANNDKKEENKTINEIHKEEKIDFSSQEIKKRIDTLEKIKGQKYSDTYIEYEVKLLMNYLQEDFESWKEKGTEESYTEISNIKDTLENYSEYLEVKDETRVLLGTLEILFQNDNWKDFNETKLNFVINELKKFNDGNIDFTSLEKFHKQLWQGKIFS